MNQQIIAGGLTHQQIIDCFTKAGVWLGTNKEDIDRQVNAVKLAFEASQAIPVVLPVKTWQKRFEELAPGADVKYATGTPGQLQCMTEEIDAYRNLFEMGPIEFVNLAGPLTGPQRTELISLCFNMKPFGFEGAEAIIRAASVAGYINGARDMKE